MIIKKKSGKPITDWRDWEPPKRAYQWAPGRSAMELARAWFTSTTPVVPPELTSLFASHSLTKTLVLTEGVPEFVTGLPERGEGRNHDLVLRGRTDQPVTVCVEAKADEPFGELVSEIWAANSDAAGKPASGSRKAQRLQSLVELLFGANAQPATAPWSDMRYQLITAAAGTALQAVEDKAAVAVFVVHEFLTTEVDRKAKVPSNAADYALFVAHLCGVQPDGVHDGTLYRATIKRSRHLTRDVELLVGKIVFDWNRST